MTYNNIDLQKKQLKIIQTEMGVVDAGFNLGGGGGGGDTLETLTPSD